jgi:hypothetical protein
LDVKETVTCGAVSLCFGKSPLFLQRSRDKHLPSTKGARLRSGSLFRGVDKAEEDCSPRRDNACEGRSTLKCTQTFMAKQCDSRA